MSDVAMCSDMILKKENNAKHEVGQCFVLNFMTVLWEVLFSAGR